MESLLQGVVPVYLESGLIVFSAIIITTALMLLLTILGMMDASTTRKLSSPFTRPVVSTTDHWSSFAFILHVRMDGTHFLRALEYSSQFVCATSLEVLDSPRLHRIPRTLAGEEFLAPVQNL